MIVSTTGHQKIPKTELLDPIQFEKIRVGKPSLTLSKYIANSPLLRRSGPHIIGKGQRGKNSLAIFIEWDIDMNNADNASADTECWGTVGNLEE